MKHRFLMTALASIMLAGGIGAVTSNTQPVQAISKLAAVSYKHGYTRVKLTKTVGLAKIHWRIPRYKSTVSNKYYMTKGTVAYVWRTGTDFGWYLKSAKHPRATYTVDKKLNDSSWYKLY